MAEPMERIASGDTMRCECVAGNHGHPVGSCEYMAKFILRPNTDTVSVPVFMRVCSPCEAQWTKVATKKG